MLSWHVHCWFMTTFMPKNKNGLLSIFFAQIRPIWDNLSSIAKNVIIGDFSHSISITEMELLMKNDFYRRGKHRVSTQTLTWEIFSGSQPIRILSSFALMTMDQTRVIWKRYRSRFSRPSLESYTKGI